jgi:hypothetical protein
MKLNKLAIAVIVVAAATLSGCVVVPPRAYIAGPPAVYVQPSGYYGHHGRHERGW